MHIYLNLAMSILVIIHSKTILIKTIKTTFSLFNQFCIIVFKHKSILFKTEPNTHKVAYSFARTSLSHLNLHSFHHLMPTL